VEHFQHQTCVLNAKVFESYATTGLGVTDMFPSYQVLGAF